MSAAAHCVTFLHTRDRIVQNMRTVTTREDLDAFAAGQRELRDSERQEALSSVRRGRALPYCPSAPGEPRKVLLIATEAHVRRVWG